MDMWSMQGRQSPYNVGGFGDVVLNPAMISLGYTMDARGNIYYPDGKLMSGPDVSSQTRPFVMPSMSSAIPITIQSGAALQTYQTPNGVPMTAQQYQQWLAVQQSSAGSKVASGLGAGFEALAAQFGVSSTTLILLIIGGVFLLMKPPPERKK